MQKGIGTIHILVILALLVLAGSVGYVYYWQQKNIAPQPPAPQSDETATWKTYSNEQYGFEVRYPTSWYVYEYGSNGVSIQSSPESAGKIIGGFVSVDPLQEVLSFDQWLENLKKVDPPKRIIGIKDITIGNIDGLAVVTLCEGCTEENVHRIISKGNRLFLINFGTFNVEEQKQADYYITINSILSTFQFTQ